MRPWNPHSQTFHGEPITGQVPVRVVVRGPEMTPQQGAMLQAAYASFVSGARLSIVSNPSAQGSLPDGSRYTIDCVNRVCTCVVWTVGGEEDMRLSGIGISLTTLGGGLVPGHIHKDKDRPQPYILTPKVHKGTRKTTGQWRKRKVDGYSGGKAVWGDKRGGAFVVGISGVATDAELVPRRTVEKVLGHNLRAYWRGTLGGGSPIYTNGQKLLGTFREHIDCLPFFLKDRDGNRWVMQITPILYPAGLQLYASKYSDVGAPTHIGEMVDGWFLPRGYSMTWQTLSVAPDGRSVRITLRYGPDNSYKKVTLSVTETSLEMVSMESAGSYTPGTDSEVLEGNPYGSYVRTRVSTPLSVTLPGGFGYDIRGEETDFSIREHQGDWKRNNRTVQTYKAWGIPLTFDNSVYMNPAGNWYTERIRTSTWLHHQYAQSITYGSTTVSFPASVDKGETRTHDTTHEWWTPDGALDKYSTNSFQSSRTVDAAGSDVIFADPLTELFVYSEAVRRVVSTQDSYNTYSRFGAGQVSVRDETTETVTKLRKLTVKCRGVDVLTVETPVADGESLGKMGYVASAAADPLTGAVCVNILEISTLLGDDSPPTRSWIILADDTGAKMLHEVIDIPNSTDIRVKGDYALLSVV